MAVVIDEDFFSSIGDMEQANHPSNADIAWFVLKYVQQPNGDMSLRPAFVRYTTLPEAIEGLVGGEAVPKPAFEQRIQEKLKAYYR